MSINDLTTFGIIFLALWQFYIYEYIAQIIMDERHISVWHHFKEGGVGEALFIYLHKILVFFTTVYVIINIWNYLIFGQLMGLIFKLN